MVDFKGLESETLKAERAPGAAERARPGFRLEPSWAGKSELQALIVLVKVQRTSSSGSADAGIHFSK